MQRRQVERGAAVTRAGESPTTGSYTTISFAFAGIRVVEEHNGPSGVEVDL